MNNKPGIAIAVVVIVIALIVVFYSKGRSENPAPTPTSSVTPTASVSAEKTYGNAKSGISFSYPDKYVISERDTTENNKLRHVIVLIDEKDLPIPENAEGPTAITVDISPNTPKQTLAQWFEKSAGFRPSTYATTTVQGVPAITYTSTGLYEIDSTAFIHEGNVVVISVSYMNVADGIRADRTRLIESLKLTATTTAELM